MSEDIKRKIESLLEEKINPMLRTHNGDSRLTSFEDGVAKIKFSGACASCMIQSDTFNDLVKASILRDIPEVRDVTIDESVSDELLDFARQILNGKR